MDEACDLVRKWLPPITDSDKITMLNIITGPKNSIGIFFIRKYTEMIQPYLKVLGIFEGGIPREDDCLASGIIFFYGCFFYIMHFPNWGSHIKNIFLYNILYILVDHYIDDINLDPLVKENSVAQMFVLVFDPTAHETMILNDPILKIIAIVYHQLITNCPKTKDLIIKLFQSEIEGLTIQKDPNLPRDKYYNIATKKGGFTMQVLQSIVGDDDPEIAAASYQLGEIMQKIDDSLDVISDRTNGIHTIATWDLKCKNNLDELWIDIVKQIGSISPRFTVFKILYSVFAVYIPDRLPENYSAELKSKTSPLNLFTCDGASLLVKTIMDELESSFLQ